MGSWVSSGSGRSKHTPSLVILPKRAKIPNMAIILLALSPVQALLDSSIASDDVLPHRDCCALVSMALAHIKIATGGALDGERDGSNITKLVRSHCPPSHSPFQVLKKHSSLSRKRENVSFPKEREKYIKRERLSKTETSGNMFLTPVL